MKVQNQRIDPVRLLVQRLLMGVLLVIFIAGSFGVRNVYQKQQESVRLKNEASMRLAALQAREDILNNDIATLGTDRGKEAALRSQYALGKQGEEMVVIVDGPSPVNLVATSTSFKGWFKKAFSWW